MATIADVEDAYLLGRAKWTEALEEIGRHFFMPYVEEALQMVYLSMTQQERELLARQYPETQELLEQYNITGGPEDYATNLPQSYPDLTELGQYSLQSQTQRSGSIQGSSAGPEYHGGAGEAKMASKGRMA